MPGGFYQNLFANSMPSYLRGPYGLTLWESMGAQLDANAEQVLEGRLQGIPFAGGPTASREGAARLADGRLMECDPFVLPIHAEQRGIVLYATESVLSQRIRVAQWWQIAREDGTHWGEIDNMRPYFSSAAAYPQITIGFQDNEGTPASTWYRVSPAGARSITKVSPSNLNYDNRPSLRTRWWAFVEMAGTGYTLPITYGSGHTYGDGSLYGQGGTSPFTRQMQADIVAMLLERKSAGSWCGGVVLIWPGYTPLDITGTPTQDADGRWSLPNGKWGSIVDPATGEATRPLGWQWIFDNPA